MQALVGKQRRPTLRSRGQGEARPLASFAGQLFFLHDPVRLEIVNSLFTLFMSVGGGVMRFGGNEVRRWGSEEMKKWESFKLWRWGGRSRYKGGRGCEEVAS